MAMFSLEAVEAKHGDCLFLHFGERSDPKLIIIDGGPRFGGSVFSSRVRPRLREMAELLGKAMPLDVELLMVSHIDDDHIGGVQLLLPHANTASGLVNIKALWHNSFDDFLDTNELDALASFSTGASVAAGFDSFTIGLAAGVKQGRDLRVDAAQKGIIANAGTASGFVAAGDAFSLGPLEFTILGPRKSELEALQGKFDAENPNAASMSASEKLRAVADFTDGSIANLASIVALVRQNTRTMLLTGDARGDHVLQALRDANLLSSNGRITVDLLKVPHHGSDRNVSTDFFRRVRARHYVFSADGKHGNPDEPTLRMLTTARRNATYTMHFTNHLDRIERFVERDHADHDRNYDVVFRDPDFTSTWVDLDEELDY